MMDNRKRNVLDDDRIGRLLVQLTLGLLFPLLAEFNRKSKESYYNGGNAKPETPEARDKVSLKR